MRKYVCLASCLTLTLLAYSQTRILVEDVAKHLGETVTVYGKIFGGKYLSRSEAKTTLLNMGGAFPNQLLTISIADSSRSKFDLKPEEFFTNKTVWVTGKVIELNDALQMLVSSPTQIKVDTSVHHSEESAPSINTLRELTPEEADGIVFTKVEVEAKFPGGLEGWSHYLEQNLKADAPTLDGAKKGIYTVKMQFIVRKDGSIDQVRAVEIPARCPHCTLEALKVIKAGPKWIPAMQNGKNVNYLTTQQISFQVLNN